MLAAIALHLLTILAYAVGKGQNLLTPMITGKKRMPADITQPRMASVIRAGFLLAVSALFVAALAKYL